MRYCGAGGAGAGYWDVESTRWNCMTVYLLSIDEVRILAGEGVLRPCDRHAHFDL